MAASIDVATILTQPRLDALFSTFDMDQNGRLSEKNIKDAFTKFGREVTDQEMKIIMQQHCTHGDEQKDHDGQYITRDEFDRIFDICVDN